MSDFTPRFKEGSLVNVVIPGIVTAGYYGKDEADMFYKVLLHLDGNTHQFQSCELIPRSKEASDGFTNIPDMA